MDMMPMIGPVKGMKAEASASVITKEELKELIAKIGKEKKRKDKNGKKGISPSKQPVR